MDKKSQTKICGFLHFCSGQIEERPGLRNQQPRGVACDTVLVPDVATRVPNLAPHTAKTGTTRANMGTNSANPGTANTGYISYQLY
jgi:hypothetical protein